MHPLQKTLWPNHYWNTSLQLLFLQKPKIFPAPACWPTNAELPLCHRKGNIGGCHYNRVVKVCFSESLALVSSAEDAFGFKNDWFAVGGLIQSHKLFSSQLNNAILLQGYILKVRRIKQQNLGALWIISQGDVLISKIFCLRQAVTFSVNLAIWIVNL